MGRIVRIVSAIAIGVGLLFFVSCNNNLTTALLDKIDKERSEIPIPGDNGKLETIVGMENITVSWTKGSDNKTSVSDLEYLVCISENEADVATVEEAVKYAFGNFEKDIETKDVTGLLDNYPYFVNVIIRDGSGNKAVYTAKSDTTVKHPRIYWTDSGSDMVRRADLDGSNAEDIISTGLTNPSAIAVDPVGRKVYFADYGSNKIMRANLDGSNVEDLITSGLLAPYGIAVDYVHNYLFWTDYTNSVIYRSSLPPTGSTDTVDFVRYDSSDGVASPAGIDVDVDAGRIFWTELGGSPRIRTALVNGVSINAPVTSDMPFDVVAHDTLSRIYWLDQTTLKLQSSDYSGTSVTDIIDVMVANAWPFGISVDMTNNMLFWIDNYTKTIYSCPVNPPTKVAADYALVITAMNSPESIDVY